MEVSVSPLTQAGGAGRWPLPGRVLVLYRASSSRKRSLLVWAARRWDQQYVSDNNPDQ